MSKDKSIFLGCNVPFAPVLFIQHVDLLPAKVNEPVGAPRPFPYKYRLGRSGRHNGNSWGLFSSKLGNHSHAGNTFKPIRHNQTD